VFVPSEFSVIVKKRMSWKVVLAELTSLCLKIT
jgi:hypothetical protein